MASDLESTLVSRLKAHQAVSLPAELRRLNERVCSGAYSEADQMWVPGATVVVAVFGGPLRIVACAWGGDCAALSLEGGAIRRLTRPDRWIEKAVSSGQVTDQEAARHPLRHVILNAIGSSSFVANEFRGHLATDEFLVLCTPGLGDALVKEPRSLPEDPRNAQDLVAAILEQDTSGPNAVVVFHEAPQ